MNVWLRGTVITSRFLPEGPEFIGLVVVFRLVRFPHRMSSFVAQKKPESHGDSSGCILNELGVTNISIHAVYSAQQLLRSVMPTSVVCRLLHVLTVSIPRAPQGDFQYRPWFLPWLEQHPLQRHALHIVSHCVGTIFKSSTLFNSYAGYTATSGVLTSWHKTVFRENIVCLQHLFIVLHLKEKEDGCSTAAGVFKLSWFWQCVKVEGIWKGNEKKKSPITI